MEHSRNLHAGNVSEKKVKTLFLDIGEVLATNGWDQNARSRAVLRFNLEADEFERRHELVFSDLEKDLLTLNEYLKTTVFYRPRQFSEAEFLKFMHDQSVLYSENFEFFKSLKKRHNLKVFAVSNECRELNEYRINKFGLRELMDAFISSSYVHIRKPDRGIYTMALDISQTKPDEIIFIDDRANQVEVAVQLGMHGIHFTDLKTAKEELAHFGLIC